MDSHARKIAALESLWSTGRPEFRLAKSTVSNLFRYEGRVAAQRRLSLAQFNEVLALDSAARTLEVEGLATFERIVTYTLAHGLLPRVAPELKHITIGGAIVGIGIESTCFKHGFVHDSLLEAEVLLPDGRIVTCTRDNEYADLYSALPNSYGTLGYILRAKIALEPAQPYVRMEVQRYNDPDTYLAAMSDAVATRAADFIEGLCFQDQRYLLMLSHFEPELDRLDDIVHRDIFYRLVEHRDEIRLHTLDYIFRYDPEWFWNLPNTAFYRLFRRYAPTSLRNSGFYTRYTARKARLLSRLPRQETRTEPLIQDWEVPWEHGRELLDYFFELVPLEGRPCAIVPIVAPSQPTLYPITPGKLYFNLGCYCHVPKATGAAPYHYTRLLDGRCFELGGIKMLYSSTFLDRSGFDRIYNGAAYAQLKRKYDPEGRARSLFDKVAMSPAAGPELSRTNPDASRS